MTDYQGLRIRNHIFQKSFKSRVHDLMSVQNLVCVGAFQPYNRNRNTQLDRVLYFSKLRASAIDTDTISKGIAISALI